MINKKHQQYFEEIRSKEEKNLEQKTALCEKLEAIDLDAIKTAAQWETTTKEVIAMQQEWREIGFAPQKMNVKIFERFRTINDVFFSKKAAFFKELKSQYSSNLERSRNSSRRHRNLLIAQTGRRQATRLSHCRKNGRPWALCLANRVNCSGRTSSMLATNSSRLATRLMRAPETRSTATWRRSAK